MYDAPRPRFASRHLSITRSAIALAVAGLVLLASAGTTLAQPGGPEATEARLAAVYFRLEDGVDVGSGPLSVAGADRPAVYRSFTVLADGESSRLYPLGGTTSVRLPAAHSSSVSLQMGAERIAATSDGFGDKLAQSIGSSRVDRFTRIAVSDGATAATIDITFEQALGRGDFVLIQESGGDAEIYLTPIDEAGTPVGAPTRVAAPYQWNMGRSDVDDVPLWATVVPAPLTIDGEAPAGLRLATHDAEVKVVALVADQNLSEDASAPTGSAALAAESGGEAGSADATASALPLTEDTAAPPVPDGTDLPDSTTSLPNTNESSTSRSSATSSTGSSAGSSSDGQLAEAATPASSGNLSLVAPEQSTTDQTAAASGTEASADDAPEALAMTGIPTEPWLLVLLAMGLIFFGWTTVLAFQGQSGPRVAGNAGRPTSGHSQLDALGFD